ncbi:hypothetical protein Tco_0747374 [Tanacetum coccineum]|uniref:Uncharacterized protein n=1 Tax=Tanacetum coccineum TaxID=301880 RepID=A0ABQ4YSJ5_9ASTR
MTYLPLRIKGLPSKLERDILPMITRNHRIVFSGLKSSPRWILVWKFATRRPTPLAVPPSMEQGQRLYTAWQFNNHPQTLRSQLKPGRVQYCTVSGVIHGTATISSVKPKANYEVLESLLRERRRQVQNEDLHTELDYYSKKYDEEKEIEAYHTPPRRKREA